MLALNTKWWSLFIVLGLILLSPSLFVQNIMVIQLLVKPELQKGQQTLP